jgi:hypothetical protein
MCHVPCDMCHVRNTRTDLIICVIFGALFISNINTDRHDEHEMETSWIGPDFVRALFIRLTE